MRDGGAPDRLLYAQWPLVRASPRLAAQAAFKQVSCECLKEFQYAEKKQTTAGVLALVSSCGLFLKIDEIFGSQSMSQV